MLTYQEAENLFMTARNPEYGKPIGRNTRLYRVHWEGNRDPHYAVRFWNTDVVTICADGTSILNSGEWRTVTTKARINQYAPGLVYQRDHSWYWRDAAGTSHDFVNRMQVTATGTLMDSPFWYGT